MVKTKVKSAYDYSEFEKKAAPVGDNMLARLAGLAADQAHAEARVTRLDEELKQAKETLRHIAENQMPELMEEVGMETFATTDGLEIKIGSKIRGSIPAASAPAAFKWLEENGHERLIKRTFTIDFNKDEEKWANKFERDLAQRKKPLAVKRKKAVNPQTLCAFVRGQLEEGVAIPMDTFGVYRQRFSTVKIKT